MRYGKSFFAGWRDVAGLYVHDRAVDYDRFPFSDAFCARKTVLMDEHPNRHLLPSVRIYVLHVVVSMVHGIGERGGGSLAHSCGPKV